MPTSAQITVAVRLWLADLLFQEGDGSEIVSWRRNVRNWRRYNWRVTLGPVDARGCRRVTVEWDEDYEYEEVIIIRRKPKPGSGYGFSFGLGGTQEFRIGWFTVTGEHHRESGIECPGDVGYASLTPSRSTVAVDGNVIWKGRESPVVSITTGGEVIPILTGADGHLAAFVEWLQAKAAPARRQGAVRPARRAIAGRSRGKRPRRSRRPA